MFSCLKHDRQNFSYQLGQQVNEKNGENKNTKFFQPQLNEIIQENEQLTEQVRHYLKKTNEILKQEHARTTKVSKKDKENALSPVSRLVSRSSHSTMNLLFHGDAFRSNYVNQK